MNDDAGPIKPKIDDAYWFKLSEDMVSKASEARDLAAGKLQSMALWLWGIFTPGAGIGFPLAGKVLPFEAKVLIVAASAALIAVYWATVWVQMPVSIKFDPRSPTQIKRAYVQGANEKGKRLQIALGLSLIAAMLVTVALVVASMSKEQKAGATKFVAGIFLQNGNRMLAVTATVGQVPKVELTMRSPASQAEPTKTKTLTYNPSEDGLLQVSLPMDGKDAPLEVSEVSLEWKDSAGTKVRLSREVGQPPK